MDVSGGHPELAAFPLITIWAFIIVSLSLGLILDFKRACTVDPKGKKDI